MKVSYYKTIKEPDSREVAEITTLLENIKNGVWEDICHKVRTAKNDEQKKTLKQSAPCFTTSGTFTKRGNNNLIQHSGLIAIDFDHVKNYGDAFNLLINDNYSFAVFASISGDGICCIVKIDGKRHLDAFDGLQKYYFDQYGLILDIACKDVSRPRFVSWDPDLHINEKSDVFRGYLKKETKQQIKRFQEFAKTDDYLIHNQSKFEMVLNRINFDITDSYVDWMKIGFAIADEYGEAGFDYFNQISQFSPKYDYNNCRKQYDNGLKNNKNDKIGIGTFYRICKQNGVDISDPRIKETREIAQKYKSVGKTLKEAIAENPEIIESVAAQEFEKKEGPAVSRHFDIDAFEEWLRSNFPIKKNEITRFYELNGKQLEQADLNTIYIDGKKLFPKLSKDICESVIFSNYTPSYNPIKDYLEGLKWDGKDYINDLAECINSNTGDLDYRRYLLGSWLLGIVESLLDEKPNILCLILAGKQNTGKSTFFTKLLPKELNRYFATSQLDRGKDDEILMCQSIIIFDDEFSGKSKQDAKHMKRMLSAPSFTLREPYGRQNVTLKRIATLCGTCNELDVLNDPTGNRRFIVFEVAGQFDYELYNSVNKAQLFAQLMSYRAEGITSEIGSEMLDKMQQNSEAFIEVNIEHELVEHFFSPTELACSKLVFMQAALIKTHIEEVTKQKLGSKRLSQALISIGCRKTKRGGVQGYLVAFKQLQS
jgi:predicted P-loop ATPase